MEYAMRRFCLILFMLCPLQLFAAGEQPASVDLVTFQQRVASVLTVRKNAYRFAQDSGLLKADTPRLTREQTNRLRDIAREYLRARNALLADAERVSDLFHNGTSLMLGTRFSTGTAVVTQGSPDEVQIAQRWLNPEDAAGQRLLLDIQRGLAAAMVRWTATALP
jgi:hypothetical protein